MNRVDAWTTGRGTGILPVLKIRILTTARMAVPQQPLTVKDIVDEEIAMKLA